MPTHLSLLSVATLILLFSHVTGVSRLHRAAIYLVRPSGFTLRVAARSGAFFCKVPYKWKTKTNVRWRARRVVVCPGSGRGWVLGRTSVEETKVIGRGPCRSPALSLMFHSRGYFQEQSRYASRHFYATWPWGRTTRPYTWATFWVQRSTLDLHSLIFCWWMMCASQVLLPEKEGTGHSINPLDEDPTSRAGCSLYFFGRGYLEPDKIHSLHAHTGRRTHSTPSTPTPNSRKSSQGSQPETFHAVMSGTSEQLANRLNMAFEISAFPP